ncbi:hypothetical protein JXB28_03180 [Candidatus Woesearchaeota archaeon]|nr:hypothetical protein [Candidatus Woesearchaeota archaeon]
MSLGYGTGNLSCRNDCRLDTVYCYNQTNFCGDNQLRAGEQCEGTQSIPCNMLNPQFTSTTLASCIQSNCTYSTRYCNGATQGRCGDNIVQTPNTAGLYEQCDGSTGGLQCSQINSLFVTGTLTCGANCLYNTTLCELSPQRICGDYAVNRLGEVCDGEDFAGTTCESLGFSGGNLSCIQETCQVNTSQCIKTNTSRFCGDGILQKPNDAIFMEQCDGTNLSGKTCTSFTGYTGGNLACYSDCTFDYSSCSRVTTPTCQDGVRNQISEECDRTDLVGFTCGFFGFTNGSLLCTNDCKLNKSLCSSTAGACGDNIVQRPNVKGADEECDGSDLDGMTCEDLEYDIGTLKCKGDCSFDQSNCSYSEVEEGFCGDGILGSYELCDGNLWGRVTGCDYFETYSGGVLACRYDNCQFDTTGCLPVSVIPNASCYDLEKNGDETDLNCGGSCPSCINGRTCLINGDCISNYCKSGICVEASCEDDMMNGLETDIDCGGNCNGCEEGKACNSGSDCLSGLFCHPFNRKCIAPSCDDGFQNGDETGIDCGGSCPLACSSNQGCMSDRDCEQGMNCVAGKCISNQNADSDGDGMPDWWENRYFLDANDPSDAYQDLDNDGRTNLDEFIDGTDPTQADGFVEESKSPLPMILLIIGIILMLLSTGFLIYSRKVLVPQQRRAAASARMAQQQAAQQKPGIKPSAMSGVGAPGSLAQRLAQRQAARKSSLKGFGDEKATEAGSQGIKTDASSVEGTKPDESKKPKDEFIPISKLGKIVDKGKEAVHSAQKHEKHKSGIFEKLKEFTMAYRKGDKGDKENLMEKKKQGEEKAGINGADNADKLKLDKLDKKPDNQPDKQADKKADDRQEEQKNKQQDKKQDSGTDENKEPDKNKGAGKKQPDNPEPKQIKG